MIAKSTAIKGRAYPDFFVFGDTEPDGRPLHWSGGHDVPPSRRGKSRAAVEERGGSGRLTHIIGRERNDAFPRLSS